MNQSCRVELFEINIYIDFKTHRLPSITFKTCPQLGQLISRKNTEQENELFFSPKKFSTVLKKIFPFHSTVRLFLEFLEKT